MALTVVVTFYCRDGGTERLATAAAVGAVQARAGIRMRRLPDADSGAAVERFPEHAESLRRMQKEYVPPREADVLAADGLIVAFPDYLSSTSADCAPFLEMLERLNPEGKLAGKSAGVIGLGPGARAAADLLRRAGVPVESLDASGVDDDVASAIAFGRRVVAAAESLKQRPA